MFKLRQHFAMLVLANFNCKLMYEQRNQDNDRDWDAEKV